MFIWQNWVGIALTLYLLKVARDERFFVFTVFTFYLFAISVSVYYFGLNSEYIEHLATKQAINLQATLSIIQFCYLPLLIISCIHLSDNKSKKHIIRFSYIASTGFKAALLTYYASSEYDGDHLTDIASNLEYFWFIPDLLVLIFGTTNPVTKRWKIL